MGEDTKPLSIEQVRELCRVWQERLRLQDWNITIRYERLHASPFDFGSAVGYCTTDHRSMEASIALLDPIDRGFVGDAWRSALDEEQVLVHELLHLLVPCPEPDEKNPEDGERAINMVADALVRLARGETRL